MSAVNIVVAPDGSWGMMATDTAAYDEDGKITAFESKTLTFPHKSMAIAVRGDTEDLAYAGAIANALPTYDLFLACAHLMFVGTFPEHRGKTGGTSGLDVFALGYSEQEKCIVAAMANDKTDFKFQRGSVVLAPDLSIDELAAIGIRADGRSLAITNPARDMLAIMERQRATVDPGHAIGGQAVLTVMSRERIMQTVVHRWPDCISKKRMGAGPWDKRSR